jgi:hypothetical protein
MAEEGEKRKQKPLTFAGRLKKSMEILWFILESLFEMENKNANCLLFYNRFDCIGSST